MFARSFCKMTLLVLAVIAAMALWNWFTSPMDFSEQDTGLAFAATAVFLEAAIAIGYAFELRAAGRAVRFLATC